ncbi:glycoside hydrolase family 25 protein [Kineothrix sp. MB12-C1]|uniref:glycoside hydrolase family 25 protein n=1 Tax=Kineothrix sp. MB12-C1 TaxID=3070215 RepID=UPI0027D2CAD0|nr:glycoside hydrolase family 25 protein [Kineothrix sp. MB12-C1]WMC92655.1 glycoside hydrolase family 25 protein [Kineothrix sp. MB12-C1]
METFNNFTEEKRVTKRRQRNTMRRRRKNKGKRSGGSLWFLAILCVIALSALTGCLLLTAKNYSLKNEVNEAMAYIDEVNSITTYTEEEMQAIIAKEVGEASEEQKAEILDEMKAMMENGDGTSAMLRYFYPDEIVVASDGRYYFFPILDTLRHHSYENEQFIMNDDMILEYKENDNIVSRKGIDVSKYQSSINWEKVAGDDVEYAFIRLGIRGSSEGKLVLDDTYEDNIEGAISNGIDVGVYFFTQALNKEEAVEEAEFVLENLEGYDITYPIVLDVEAIEVKNPRTKGMTKQDWTDVCIAFCETIREAGYTPMIYGNLKTFFLMVDMEQLEAYEKWFAYYNTPLYFPYEFSIWQYTSTGKVNGIKGDVDLNVSMKDWKNE